MGLKIKIYSHHNFQQTLTTMDKRSVAPPTTTPPNVVCLPKCHAIGLEIDCCVRKPRKRLVCPPTQPAWISPESSWRWMCDVCGYCSCYLHKVEKCENLHFGPLLTTLLDDDDDDVGDDDDGWLVNDVIIRSDQPSPAITAAAARGLPTPRTVSSSDGKDVGVKLTVDDGPIAAAAEAEGILRLHSKPKVSQSRCGLVYRGRSLSDRTGGKSTSAPQYQCLAFLSQTMSRLDQASSYFIFLF